MTKGQRCLCYCSYFTLGPFVSKEKRSSIWDRDVAQHTQGPELIAQWSRATHVLVQGPLMCE